MSFKTIQTIVLFGTLAVFLYLVNTGIWGAEQRINNGKPVYLDLAPRDPRSLIQGDYMVLRYSIEQDAMADNLTDTHRGKIVAVLDENNVAHYDRHYQEGETIAENEILLNYTARERGVRIGVDSFFFQEGQGDKYARARYAETRVTPDGTIMLIDLVSEDFETLVDKN